jgi:hypothetical protein
MAKTILNTALGSLRGRVDGWVYRRQNGQLVVAKRPDFSEVVPTVAQLAVRERFNQAASYASQALADPAQHAVYTSLARERESNAFAVALTDWLRPPEVFAIDVSGYHGAVGDPIVVRADDDVEVTGVVVTLRDTAEAVLEQGAALAANGAWVYTATTAVPAGTVLAIEAAASDRPGHRGTRTVPWPA